MATFNADTDLGTQVITGSKVWSNGTSGTIASPTDIVFGSTAVDVTGTDITVVTNGIGNGHGTTTNGSLTLTGCILNIVDPGGTGQTRVCGITNGTYDFDNTTIVGSLGAYATWGAWNTVQGTYNLNNFTLATDILTGDLATLSFFTGNLSANSSFNNPAFWNGQAGANARGGVWQTSTNQIYNGVVTPPAGIDFNHTNLRAFHRWANQITGNPLTTTNHTGVAPNFDFRSLQHVDNSAAAFFLDVDGGASMAHINWLPGVPTNSLRHGFKCIFGVGARAQVFIATNPVLANPTGTDGEHLLNFTTADITSTANLGVYLPTTEAWDPTTAGTPVWDGEMITNKSQAVTTATLNGLYFRNQKFEESTGALNTSDASFAEFVDLAPKTYRKYSWLQQPSDAAGWGKEVTIAVPPNNATDAEVATARAGGYDVYNGTTWETETDISDPTDIITSSVATVDTFAKAYAGQDSTSSSAGFVTRGSEAVAVCKALAWNAATGASDFTAGGSDLVGDDNTHVPLDYTITGTTVRFGGQIGFGTARGLREIDNGEVEYRVKIAGTVLKDDFITAFEAPRISFSSAIDGTQENCDFTGDDEIRINGSIENLRLTVRKTDGTGQIYGKQSTGQQPDSVTYDADIIRTRLPSDGTYTTEELLGTNYVIVNGAVDTLRPQSTSHTITISATDANVAEFNLTANADGTGGELQRGSSVTVQVSGYGTVIWNRPAAPAVSYPVNVETPSSTTGRFVINNQATDAVLYAGTWASDGTITTTADNRVTDAAGNVGVGSEDATIYQWFAKAESTIGGRVFRMGGGIFQGTALPEGSIVTATPTLVNNFFVQNATEENGADGSTLLAVTDTSSGNKFQFIWSNTTSAAPAGGNATQGAIIKGANSINYFNWLVANNYTADPVDYRPGSVIWNNDADGVTGIATADGVFNNSANNTTQNTIGNASLGLKSDNTTVAGATQVVSVDDGEASLATVNNAIAGLFAQSAGLTEQAFDDIMDQINDKVNTSSLGIPTSGDLT